MIRRLLVANRAEIASRVFRTCRRLGIETVAVFTPPDDSLPFVREADVAVPVDSYLSAEAFVAAAVRAGADAVHPGYGFLAESPELAARCADAGLVWIGPPPEVLELAASKLAARELAERAGVAVLPVDEEAGFPSLVKAAWGGGGRGMRIVHSPDELDVALASAEREAVGAFGDGALYRERFVEGARHVEVQIAGDVDGGVAHLWGRECSVQQRYQKVVEEAPFVDERMLEAAVRIARELGYVGLGTVEFLLAPAGEFFFLEVNARLQVEHPVTEAVTGLDLVELQLALAEGRPVPSNTVLLGHAAEARIYAEGAGTLHRFRVEGVRVDTGVADGSRVGTEYDPMLAKVVAHGPTREHAVRQLVTALRRARIHGVPTNRNRLVALLEHPDFGAGRVDTQWLERVDPQPTPFDERLHAAAAALAGQAERRHGHTLPSGWRNNASQLQRTRFDGFDVGYRMHPFALEVNGQEVAAGLVSYGLLCRGTPPPPHGYPSADSSAEAEVVLALDGVRHGFAVHRVGDTYYVDSALGHSELRELPRFASPSADAAPGSLVAPMPGAVARVAVEPGANVAQGTPLVVIDAMKMEHTVAAPRAGRVAEVRVHEGEQVVGGQVLVVLADE